MYVTEGTDYGHASLNDGIRSEKCVVRRFRRCGNVIECTYTNPDSITYYTPRLLLLGYKPVQHVTVLNTVGNCNTMVSIIILLAGVPGVARDDQWRNWIAMLCII